MQNDDSSVGRLLSRREVLALFGAAGAALIVGCSGDDDSPTVRAASPTSGAAGVATAGPSAVATFAAVPSCVVRPEQTEGPYFVDEMLNRSDIRTDPSTGAASEGVPVALIFNVSEVVGGDCTSLAGATVDVWHCDALGVYSDVTDTAEGFDTTGQKFLRGYQLTDVNGQAAFTTIYPGWYQGRTVHIHFKIRTQDGLEFTSQLYFDDDLTDEVHALSPYAQKGVRTLRNDGDGIFGQDGEQLLLALTPSGEGYAATFDIGLQTG
ncbi:MAG: intradiol ring-cleavage dioxygenase [Dehalococcoidia bacterium]